MPVYDTLLYSQISQDCYKHDVQNYLNYYSRVPGPLRELVASSPMQVYVYAKAAEDAVEQYNHKYQVKLFVIHYCSVQA